MKILAFITLIFLTACTTNPHSEGHDSYVRKIENSSAGDKQFAGIYHNFEFRTTFMNQNISKTIHDRLTKIYAWSEQENNEKLQERMSKLSDKTRFWLSFFTTDRVNDNLATKKSIWKVYLKTGSQRYEGQISKTNMNQSEAQALIPYHNRWTTAYYVDFPVPTSEIEGQDIEFIITGPLGRRAVQF